MPLRDLFYVADLLQKIVKDKNLYSSCLVGIPTPKFVMFYNGTDEEAAQMEIAEAVNRAVDECIAEGVLGDFLSEHRAEAVAMSIYEYDEEKHMKAEREEHYALGFQQGYYEAFLEMGLSEEEARRRAEMAVTDADVYDEEKRRKTEEQKRYESGLQDGIEKGLRQGRYEVYLEMGLSAEEARRKAAEKCSLEETDNVGEHGETK